MCADNVAVELSESAPPSRPPAVSTPRLSEPTKTPELSTERPESRKETEQMSNVGRTATSSATTAETLNLDPRLPPPSTAEASAPSEKAKPAYEKPAYGKFGPVRPYEIDVLGYSGAFLLFFNGVMTGIFRKGYMRDAGLLPGNNNHRSRTCVTRAHISFIIACP